jgi:dTDP-glucose 4,6-dehydratase
VKAICATMDALRPDQAPHDRLITFVADRPGHDRRYAIDAAKVTNELGWRPRASFEAGLGDTVRWYLDNQAWWQPLLPRAGGRLGLAVAAR